LGWTAILIESDKLTFDRLVENCKGYPNARPVFGKLGVDCTLDDILKLHDAPKDIDLMVVDIDGQDYHVINAMMKYEPRVLIAEYNPNADSEYIPVIGGGDVEGLNQAGRTAMIRLGSSKGYQSCIENPVNLILIHKNNLQKLDTVKVQAEPIAEMTKTVSTRMAAIMSCPRLGFTNNLMLATKVIVPLGIEFEVGYGVFWSQILTKMIEEQIAKGMEWIAILDYDSYYQKEHFLALCQLMHEYPNADAIMPIQIKRENDSVLAGVNDPKKANCEYDVNTDLIEVDTGHFGLTIFKASAFAKLKKPWFIGVPDEKGEWGPGHLDDDIYFWKNWRKCGLKAYLAPQVLIGHMQLMVTWPGTFEVGAKPTHQYISTCTDKGIPEWCKVPKKYVPKQIK